MQFSKIITSIELGQDGRTIVPCCYHGLPSYAMEIIAGFGIQEKQYDQWQAWLTIAKYELSIKHAFIDSELLKVTGRFGYWRSKSFTMVFEIYDLSEEELYAIATIVFHFKDKHDNVLPVPAEFQNRLTLQQEHI